MCFIVSVLSLVSSYITFSSFVITVNTPFNAFAFSTLIKTFLVRTSIFRSISQAIYSTSLDSFLSWFNKKKWFLIQYLLYQRKCQSCFPPNCASMIGLLSTVKFPGFHMNVWSFNKLKPSILTSTCPRGGGGTLEFRWQGWSNGGKNRNQNKYLGIPTKPEQKSRDKKLIPKKFHDKP